jgi:hypothetical protein
MPCFLRRLLWPIALEIDPDFRSGLIQLERLMYFSRFFLIFNFFLFVDVSSHSLKPFVTSVYASLSTAREVAHEIDHQLDIDIPRCHQVRKPHFFISFHFGFELCIFLHCSTILCWRRHLFTCVSDESSSRFWLTIRNFGIGKVSIRCVHQFWPCSGQMKRWYLLCSGTHFEPLS